MSNWFSHSGDLGDIIYGLPAIRAAGGGILYLFDAPGKTAHGMSPAKAERLRKLLILQPYIEDVIFKQDIPDHNINGFRHHSQAGNLADMHLHSLGLTWEERSRRWLDVDYIDDRYPVIFSRSPRYHNDRFPWARIREVYGDQAAFVGFPDEYESFCDSFGKVDYAQADDLLEVARLIAGCQLYVGNFSMPSAVAEGLKQSMILEICPWCHHLAIFQRLNCILGWDEKIEFPELDQLEAFARVARSCSAREPAASTLCNPTLS